MGLSIFYNPSRENTKLTHSRGQVFNKKLLTSYEQCRHPFPVISQPMATPT